jgi:heme oxygenase
VAVFDQGLLSAVLRRRLRPAHAALEQASGLPGKVVTLADYIAHLKLYHRLFARLEHALDAFPHAAAGSGFVPVRRAPLLENDLCHLGAFRPEPIAPMALTSLAQAFGVRYVLEGSALGGQVILAALQPRLGSEIAGATSFFVGLGRQSMANWRAFQTELDQYGIDHPDEHDNVVDGGALCFGMFLEAALDFDMSVPA